MLIIKSVKDVCKLSRTLFTLSTQKPPGNVPIPLKNDPTVDKSTNVLRSMNGPPNIHFSPSSISFNIISPIINQTNREIIDQRQFPNIQIENPNPIGTVTEIIDNVNRADFDLPTNSNKHGDDGYQAVVMIGIRRKKMKKHKLKKLRKKMRFEWAKVRQRRELRKEKAFQAELIGQIKQAEKFSAEQYVAEKLRQANEVPIPKYYKHKRLPQFLIKQLLGIK